MPAWYLGWIVGALFSGMPISVDLFNPFGPFATIVGALITPPMILVLIVAGAWCFVFVAKRMPQWTSVFTVIISALLAYGIRIAWRSK